MQVTLGTYPVNSTGCWSRQQLITAGNFDSLNSLGFLGLYFIPDCASPAPPTPPLPPPSPPMPFSPSPPPTPPSPPAPPPRPPLPPNPNPPPMPPAPPASNLTSTITFTSTAKRFTQGDDCEIGRMALMYYIAGRNWMVACNTGFVQSGTRQLSTISWVVYTTDPTGVTGMLYIAESLRNQIWWVLSRAYDG
jgi:hypothetical protein